jgi:hypothetical protein
MNCKDPSTWPEPSAEHTCEDSGYGMVRVRAWANLHPKSQGAGTRRPRQPRTFAHRARDACVGGG